LQLPSVSEEYLFHFYPEESPFHEVIRDQLQIDSELSISVHDRVIKCPLRVSFSKSSGTPIEELAADQRHVHLRMRVAGVKLIFVISLEAPKAVVTL
jgi:hypothetical protein